ncbi:MAG: DUF4294 domain-containing protein [Bacteroidia bacterium]|nr:DUF4294 domain-containing protein [Bacteroidia bacterium]
MKRSVLTFLSVMIVTLASAQADSTKAKKQHPVNLDSIEVVRVIVDSASGDTLLFYRFEEVVLKDFNTPEQKEEYRRLKYNVKKVMPYAKLAAFRLQMMEDNLLLINDPKAREKYIKETEKSLKEDFMETLKGFSRSQGLLLIKLMHRETGKTTYDILKGYRGNVETFYWSAFAKMYNANLKVEYDPIVDYQLDMIIKAYNLE